MPGIVPQGLGVSRPRTSTDHCNNSATRSQVITVIDTTAPLISTLPAPSAIECPATPSFTTPTAIGSEERRAGIDGIDRRWLDECRQDEWGPATGTVVTQG